MATTTAADQSTLCKITNNSGVEMVVAATLTKFDSPSTNSIVSVNKDLEILPRAGGGTIFPAAATDTITLNRNRTTTEGKVVPNHVYDLKFLTANWLSPVANVGLNWSFDDDNNHYYAPQTITADSKTAMQQAVTFFQTISAYPDSALAKKYIDAMGGADAAATAAADGSADSANAVSSAIAKSVNGFFAATDTYKKVTLAELVAVERYYNQFPFAWAQYKDTESYYLYCSDGKKTTFQGILSLKKGTVDITKPSAGYSCSFIPAVDPSDTSKIAVNNSNAKSLVFSNGLFQDDVNSDLPGIALKGIFQLKRTFSKKPSDTQIIPVITGTIDGQIVVGFDGSQATTPDDTTQDWLNSLFHPKTAAEIFNSVMQILGALMMLHFVVSTLWSAGSWLREQISAKEPVTKDDFTKEKSNAESEYKAEQKSSLEKASGNKSQLPENSESALDSAVSSKSALSDQVTKSQIETNVRKMNQNVEDMEPYVADDDALNSRLEDMGDSIEGAMEELNSEVKSLTEVVKELRGQMETMSKTMAELTTDIQNKLAQEQGDDISESVDEMNKIQSETEEEKTTNEDEGKDGTSEDPEGEPIEFPEI